MFGIRKWLDHKLGVDVYELRDRSIVKDRGRSPADVVALEAIASWHVEYEMIFDIVTIQLKNGAALRWLDKYNDLLDILRTEARAKQTEPNQASDATSNPAPDAGFSAHHR